MVFSTVETISRTNVCKQQRARFPHLVTRYFADLHIFNTIASTIQRASLRSWRLCVKLFWNLGILFLGTCRLAEGPTRCGDGHTSGHAEKFQTFAMFCKKKCYIT